MNAARCAVDSVQLDRSQARAVAAVVTRLLAGKTQAELGVEIGVGKNVISTLSRAHTGTTVGGPVLDAIARRVGVTRADLLAGKEKR